MKYTKNDLENNSHTLMYTITQIGKELERKDTPRSRALGIKLLSNFNEYDTKQMTRMINDFQQLLVESLGNEETHDAENVAYLVVKDKMSSLKKIIMFEE